MKLSAWSLAILASAAAQPAAQPAALVAHVRISAWQIDLASTAHAARALLADLQGFEPLMRRDAIARLRAASAFLRGVERSPLARAVAALAAGRLDVAVLEARGGRLVFAAHAKVADASTAQDIARVARKFFKLEIRRMGARLDWSSDFAASSSIDLAALEIADAKLALRLALSGTRFARQFVRAAARPAQDLGAALFLAQLGSSFGGAEHAEWTLETGGATTSRASLRMRLPGAWTRLDPATRRIFAAEAQPERALRNTASHPDDILRFDMRRDFAAFLEAHASFCSQRARDEVQELLSGLELLFRGAVIERDIAPALGCGVAGTLRCAPSTAEGVSETLPIFALRSSAHAQRLRSVLDAAISVLRIVGAQARKRDGRLPLRLMSRRAGDVRRTWTQVQGARSGRPAPVRGQLAPAYARLGPDFAFGTSIDLCTDVVRRAASRRAAAPRPSSGATRADQAGAWRALDQIVLYGPGALRSMQQNRELIDTGLWLRQGLEARERSQVVRASEALLARLGRASMTSGFRGDAFEVELCWEGTR